MNNEFEKDINTAAENAENSKESETISVQEASVNEDIPVTQDDFEEIPPDKEEPSYSFGEGSGFSSPEITVTHNEPKKRKGKGLKIACLALVCGIVFGIGFGLANGFTKRLAISNISIGTTDVSLSKSEGKKAPVSDVARIAEACMPSVVAITNRSVSDVMTFFGTYSQESTSTGSGIIIGKNDAELLIVTNYHVVANAKELSVVFSAVESRLEMQAQQSDSGVIENKVDDDSIPPATVKGYDAAKDLAVVAVSLDEIPEDILKEIKIATIGDSSTLKPGDQVVAIGNALGYGQSVTTGIISAVNRKITMESSDGFSTVTNTFIQTDAAINQGNSGGALLDMAGNVIGINSVKIATTGVEGMGYAIPITDVESIIDELMVKKTRDIVDEDKQGYLGISGSDVTASVSQVYGLPLGVFVNGVEKGLAADKAGIKKGYIIVKFDGFTISSIAQLQDRLRYYEEGEKVKVTVKVPKDDTYVEKEVEVLLSNRSKNIKNAED